MCKNKTNLSKCVFYFNLISFKAPINVVSQTGLNSDYEGEIKNCIPPKEKLNKNSTVSAQSSLHLSSFVSMCINQQVLVVTCGAERLMSCIMLITITKQCEYYMSRLTILQQQIQYNHDALLFVCCVYLPKSPKLQVQANITEA